jgi:hypothetical protein
MIDVASGTVHRPAWGLSLMGYSDASAFAGDGESFFLSGMQGLTRIRMSDGVVLERIPHPIIYGRILTAPDGSRLLTISNDAEACSSQVTVRQVALH